MIAAYAGRMIQRHSALRRSWLAAGLALFVVLPLHAAKRKSHNRTPRYAVLGAVRTVPYSVAGDPAGALPGETSLHVRPLVVAGKIKGWTTGAVHLITPDSFAVQSAIQMNNALPGSKRASWVWQRGSWLLVHRDGGKISLLRLPDYDPAVSRVVWFRNYAAYCGLSASGKRLYAVVEQMGVRRPVISRELSAWNASSPVTPACAPPVWQITPLAVSFAPTGDAATTYDLFPPAATQPAQVASSEPAPAP